MEFLDPETVAKISEMAHGLQVKRLSREEIVQFAETTYEKVKKLYPVNKQKYMQYVMMEYEKTASMTDVEFKDYIMAQSEYAVQNLKQVERRLMHIMENNKKIPWHKKIKQRIIKWLS